jgi:hypothetical protein
MEESTGVFRVCGQRERMRVHRVRQMLQGELHGSGRTCIWHMSTSNALRPSGAVSAAPRAAVLPAVFPPRFPAQMHENVRATVRVADGVALTGVPRVHKRVYLHSRPVGPALCVFRDHVAR